MRKLALISILALSLSQPAFAEGQLIGDFDKDGRVHSTGAPTWGVGSTARKQNFSQRHPRLHKAGRFIRRTCQILNPIVSFAGSAAQVTGLFIK